MYLDHHYFLRADINATNSGTGWTACHCAAFQGHGKVLMYLIQYQPDITIQDTMGRLDTLNSKILYCVPVEQL